MSSEPPIDSYVDGAAHFCRGVDVRSGTLEVATGDKMPTLLFDFHLVGGRVLPPVVLVLSVDDMLGFKRLVRAAVRDAVQAAQS